MTEAGRNVVEFPNQVDNVFVNLVALGGRRESQEVLIGDLPEELSSKAKIMMGGCVLIVKYSFSGGVLFVGEQEFIQKHFPVVMKSNSAGLYFDGNMSIENLESTLKRIKII